LFPPVRASRSKPRWPLPWRAIPHEDHGARLGETLSAGHAGSVALAARDSGAAGVECDKKNPAAALTALQATVPPIELGQILFVTNISCLYPTYIHREAYLAAGQGKEAAAEFQKIIDHSGIVWNCWTGALAHLGVARANALQARIFHAQGQGADADLARTRAIADYKDFLTLLNDADPDIPILKEAKAEYAKLQ